MAITVKSFVLKSDKAPLSGFLYGCRTKRSLLWRFSCFLLELLVALCFYIIFYILRPMFIFPLVSSTEDRI